MYILNKNSAILYKVLQSISYSARIVIKFVEAFFVSYVGLVIAVLLVAEENTSFSEFRVAIQSDVVLIAAFLFAATYTLMWWAVIAPALIGENESASLALTSYREKEMKKGVNNDNP
jgi:hypothetical protein